MGDIRDHYPDYARLDARLQMAGREIRRDLDIRGERDAPKHLRQRAKTRLFMITHVPDHYARLRQILERGFLRWAARREGYSSKQRRYARSPETSMRTVAAGVERRRHRATRKRRRGWA